MKILAVLVSIIIVTMFFRALEEWFPSVGFEATKGLIRTAAGMLAGWVLFGALRGGEDS